MTETVEVPQQAIQAILNRVNDLEETVEEQGETIEQQADRIETLEKEVDTQSSNIGGVHNRISRLEETMESGEDPSLADEPGVGDDETGSETPLERIATTPEHQVDQLGLTANQERARFIAKDVRDYAEKAPAGLVISSRDVKKVIAAKEGERPHNQTVARVMDFLDTLGKDDVDMVKRRGRNLIVVDPDAADRLMACNDRCDGGNGPTPAGTVTSGG